MAERDPKKIERLRELLRELRCTDGGCIFRVPGEPSGMTTNGGCRCLNEFRDGIDTHDSNNRKLKQVVQILMGLVIGAGGFDG